MKVIWVEVKVDGIGESGRSNWVQVDGPQNCVDNLKMMKADGLRMRGWSKRDESGRSSK